MGEITSKYNYSTLDSLTKDFLKEKELKIYSIVGKAATEIGKEYSEARDKLANYSGEFEKWIETLPHSRTTVYRMIQRYENLVIPNWDNLEIIEAIPSSLSYEMAKEKANPILNQKVLAGNITTLKEYKELEKLLKESQKENEELKSQKPTVIEKEVVKEVVPNDYDELKEKSKHHAKEIKEYQKQLKDLADENFKKFQEITAMQLKQEEALKEMPSNKRNEKLVADAWSFVRGVEALLKEFGGMVYLTQSIKELPKQERTYYINAIENVYGWSSQIKFNLEEELKK